MTETCDNNKQPCKLNEIDKALEHCDKGLSEATIPVENVVPQRHGSTEAYTEKKRVEIVCRSLEIGNEVRRNNTQTIASEVGDNGHVSFTKPCFGVGISHALKAYGLCSNLDHLYLRY